MHELLNAEFVRQDAAGTGTASWAQFLAAFNSVSKAHRLYLTESELTKVFQEAAQTGCGTINYR